MYERIKRILEARKETFPSLSNATGVPLNTLYNLRDRPGGSLSLRHTLSIAQHFGMTIDELCEGVKFNEYNSKRSKSDS